MAEPAKRPDGVIVIAILVIINGILLLLGAVLSGVVAAMLPAWPTGVNLEFRDEFTRNLYFDAPELLQITFAAMSAAFIAMGAISMVVAWGLLKGKPWSWTVALIMSLISLVRTAASFAMAPTFNTVTTEVFGLALNLAIIYYLCRPHVKAFFGKSAAPLSSEPHF